MRDGWARKIAIVRLILFYSLQNLEITIYSRVRLYYLGAGGDGYDWYNTHPDSFNTISTQQAAYRLFIAAVLAGIGKLVLKIVPSLIFGTLFKLKIVQPKSIHLKDCFGRAVPDSKSYVVEIPVR